MNVSVIDYHSKETLASYDCSGPLEATALCELLELHGFGTDEGFWHHGSTTVTPEGMVVLVTKPDKLDEATGEGRR